MPFLAPTLVKDDPLFALVLIHQVLICTAWRWQIKTKLVADKSCRLIIF